MDIFGYKGWRVVAYIRGGQNYFVGPIVYSTNHCYW